MLFFVIIIIVVDHSIAILNLEIRNVITMAFTIPSSDQIRRVSSFCEARPATARVTVEVLPKCDEGNVS